MRRYDEPVHVRPGLVGGVEAPAQFLWRDRLWLVHEIETRWTRAGAGWHGSAARATPGRDPDLREVGGEGPGLTADPLVEEEVWRVVAGAGRSAPIGVCELARSRATGDWRLLGVLD